MLTQATLNGRAMSVQFVTKAKNLKICFFHLPSYFKHKLMQIILTQIKAINKH